MSIQISCDSCRKKPAVVKASFLNKKLCLECYLSELEKKVKRNISALKLKELAQHIFVPLHPLFPLPSLLLYKIVEKIEKKFQKKPILLIIQNSVLPVNLDINPDNVYSVKLDENVMEILEKKKRQGLVGYWRVLRAIYVASIKNFRNAFLVLPGCADFLAFLDLYSFITGIESSNENIPVLSLVLDEQPGIVNGFYGVPCNEVLVASYLLFRNTSLDLNLREQPLLTKIESIIYRMLLDAVKERSYEALINIEKTFLFMASSLEYKKCSYCRGASRANICVFCRELEDNL